MTTTITTRVEFGVGIIEVDGSLRDDEVAALRTAIITAGEQSDAGFVLVVVDKLISVDRHAALLLAAECATLQITGGNMAWVSDTGWLPTLGNPRLALLNLQVYERLDDALRLFPATGPVRPEGSS